MNSRDLSEAAKGQLRGRRKVLKRPPAVLFPDAAERAYVRAIMKIDNAMVSEVKKTLLPALPRILKLAEAQRPTFDSFRADEYDYTIEVSNLMSLIRSNYNSLFSDADIAALVLAIGKAVEAQNGKELGKVFRSVLGVDLFKSEPWLASEMQAFVSQNVGLIKTLPERFFPAIEQKVYSAARQGISYQVLQKDLKKEYDTTNYQAERIARDQVGKFNGQLTRLRQQQAGINRYIWRTARDDRVRKQHQDREAKPFSWDDPPSGGHPGEAIQCRCFAEAILDDLLDY